MPRDNLMRACLVLSCSKPSIVWVLDPENRQIAPKMQRCSRTGAGFLDPASPCQLRLEIRDWIVTDDTKQVSYRPNILGIEEIRSSHPDS